LYLLTICYSRSHQNRNPSVNSTTQAGAATGTDQQGR